MILIKIMVYAELGQNPHFTCHNVIDNLDDSIQRVIIIIENERF
jgi:hypothetical protein